MSASNVYSAYTDLKWEISRTVVMLSVVIPFCAEGIAKQQLIEERAKLQAALEAASRKVAA